MRQSFDICQRWPRSSEKFTEAQLEIWRMKLSGLSFEKVQNIIEENANDRISTSCLYACIKRTATGHAWTPHAKEGREPYLNLDEEAALADWVNAAPSQRTLEEMLDAVVQVREQGLRDVAPVLEAMGCAMMIQNMRNELQRPSRSWGYDMLKELNMTLATPEPLERVREEYATSALITRWFEQMSPEMQGCEQSLIFNFDESMLFARSKSKVIMSGSKKAFTKKVPNGPHMTVGLCFSSLGFHPPPMIILPTIRPVPEFQYLQSVGAVQIENSPSGWMTYDLFRKWAEGFCRWLKIHRETLSDELKEKPAILFIDNCRTHCQRDALLLLARNGVKVISFPPHVTHVLQPIDVGCVRAFKAALCKNARYFEKNLKAFLNVSTDAGRRRAQFVLATISAVKACEYKVCSNAFRKAGLCPFSPDEPLKSHYVKESEIDPEAIHRANRPNLFHSGSTVMTNEDFLARLAERIPEVQAAP